MYELGNMSMVQKQTKIMNVLNSDINTIQISSDEATLTKYNKVTVNLVIT